MRNTKIFLFKQASLLLSMLLIIVGCDNVFQAPTNTIFEPDTSIAAQPTTPATETVALTIQSTKTSANSSVNLEIPTPVGEREQEQVLWLFETNNQCLLPCFWGIVPGETTWTNAEKLFKRFDGNINKNSLGNLVGYSPLIDLPREIFSASQTRVGILTSNDIVNRINTQISIGETPDNFLNNFRLANFLTEYGKPTEVWVSSSPQPFENNELPFRIILFYEELGIMILYADNASLEGENVVGCPQSQPAKALSVWSPNDPLSFDEAKNGYAGFSGDFLPLDEVSSLNIEGFYNLFKNPENTSCITTPADAWRFN